MNSVAPRTRPADIGQYWTDEEICIWLGRMIQGSSTPENVTADINPYQYMPSNLPDDIWYFIRSEQKKDSEHGFWIVRGEACEIFRNSSITGWRTTLEFFEGRAPNGRRTNWVMQEYTITPKGPVINSNSKESSSLCRVFRTSGASPNQEKQHKLGDSEIAEGNQSCPKPSVVPETGSTTGHGSLSASQARTMDENIGPLAADEGHLNIPVEDMHDMDYYLSRGEYLELDDLVDRGSRSSSSDNTSCLTLTSEECFDSLALLKDLEDELNRGEPEKDANCKFSVAGSVRPNEVVMRPANLGSLITSNGSQSPAEVDNNSVGKRVPKHVSKHQEANNGNEGTSDSLKVATSSSSHKAVSGGEKKARVGRVKKLKKKYLCFFPF